METISPSLELSYFEHRVIDRLLEAHVAEHGTRLRAVVVFGDVLRVPDSLDFDLLEIIEGWDGPKFGRYHSSAELPLRGELRLYVLSPEEFADPEVIKDPVEREWVSKVIARVRAGYRVMLDEPYGWFSDVARIPREYLSTLSPPPSGAIVGDSPLRLNRAQRRARW